ncbi:MAG: DMT family transporter [Anaerolineae bacterium]|nr:DMT family transporter [Anaerolineae bacterium]
MGLLIGLLCAASWAAGTVSIRNLAKKIEPITLTAARVSVGAVAVLLLTLFTGRMQDYALITVDKLLMMIGSMWIGGGLGDVLSVASIARLGVSRSYPILSTYPAITLILGVIFLQESVTLGIILGLVLVIIGIALVGGKPQGVGEDVELSARHRSGVSLALLAATCWAGAMIILAPSIEGVDSLVVASIRTPALALFLWVIVLARRTWKQLQGLSWQEWGFLLIGGLIGWGVGSALFVLTVSLSGPTRASIVTSTSPIFALAMSTLFFKERVNAAVIVGTVLTVVGVILVS